jgi:hypothetical protein
MNLKTVRNAIVSILDANNTTTSSYDISGSLQTRVQRVIAGHPKRPVGLDEYPVIFVSLSGKSEESPFLGDSAARDVSVDWTVHCLTCLSESATSAENECITLTDNVEHTLRNYIDLSGTVDYSTLDSTEYSLEDENSTYVHTGRIGLVTKLWSRT